MMAMDEDLEEIGGVASSSETLVKRKPQQIADLERKIWTQIAKKDIPKVRISPSVEAANLA